MERVSRLIALRVRLKHDIGARKLHVLSALRFECSDNVRGTRADLITKSDCDDGCENLMKLALGTSTISASEDRTTTSISFFGKLQFGKFIMVMHLNGVRL